MTEPFAGRATSPAPFDWEGEGLHVGESLDQFHCIVVVGEDVEATARVALGLSRAQSSRRRVALGDLLGEAPPIQALVEGDDPHGLVDSFLYGVSLNRIARLVPDAGELFILPTGSEPIDYEEMLGDPRWQRLASGFREVGALLVIAAPASAPAVEQLVAASDGAILVGEAVPPQLPVAQVIASVREPAPHPQSAEETDEEAAAPRAPRWWQLIPLPVAGAAIAAAVLVVVVGLWLVLRSFGGPQSRIAAVQPQRTTATAAGTAVSDSAARADSIRSAMAASAAPAITNPADSATASPFAVSWLKFNTRSGALLRLQADGLPAATITPVIVSNSPWYELRIGAYTDSAEAESLLATLRGNESLSGDAGRVIRAPLAFVVDSAGFGDDARRLYAEYSARQLPVYCLRGTPTSRVHLYVGAFSSAVESSLYAGMLRAEGITPVLVYRIGRVYKCA